MNMVAYSKLVEQMREILADVAVAADTTADLGGVNLLREEVLEAVAVEVVRNMLWVRDEAAALVGGPAEDTHEAIMDMHITPAPDDWDEIL